MLAAVIKLYENSEYVQKYKKKVREKKEKKKKPKTHYQIQGKLSVAQLSLKRIRTNMLKKTTPVVQNKSCISCISIRSVKS